MAAQQQPRPAPAITSQERIAQINRTLDTLDENMLNLARSVSDYAERHGWTDRLTLSGLEQIHVMKVRIAELQEERRQLYAAPRTSIAS